MQRYCRGLNADSTLYDYGVPACEHNPNDCALYIPILTRIIVASEIINYVSSRTLSNSSVGAVTDELARGHDNHVAKRRNKMTL